jgi:hypothetical protein
MNRSQMLKLMYKLNKFITLINKYIYILPIISMLTNLSYFKNNKFFILLRNLLKILIVVRGWRGPEISIYLL